MKNIYDIAGSTIDLCKLVSVGDINIEYSGLVTLPLIFNFNSNVKVIFQAGQNGLPEYHSSGQDWTERDSNFYRAVVTERDKLIETWVELTRLK